MDYKEHEAAVIAGATMFVACAYAGRATYHRAECKTLANARRAARAMIGKRAPEDKINKGRPVLIYAVNGINQVVAETVYP